jgi:lysozyme
VISRLFADLSSNNPTFDVTAYHTAGHRLVAIKATEGTFYTNPDHRPWSLQAGANRIGIIHYHFARPDLNTTPLQEATHFCNVALPNTGGRDFLALDLERAAPAGWTHDPAWSRGFDEAVTEITHSRFAIILYASRSVLEMSDEWLVSRPPRRRVWDADYSSSSDYTPLGYTLAARQFTDGVLGPEPHELPGVGRCDVNRIGPALWGEVLRWPC